MQKLTTGPKNTAARAQIGGAGALRAVKRGVTPEAATGRNQGQKARIQRDIFGKSAGTCPFARNTRVFQGSSPFSGPGSKGTVF